MLLPSGNTFKCHDKVWTFFAAYDPILHTYIPTYCVCVCVCVCFLPIHSGHQLRWTYQAGSHRGKVTQIFFIHLPSAVRGLIFLGRRIQPFHSLVDREVEFLCTNVLIVLH